MWVTAGVAVVVAGAVAILAAFLDEDARPAPRRGGTITAEELRTAQPPVAWRGYERGHVDALLARAALTLEEVRRYGPEVHDDDLPAATVAAGPSAVPPSFLAETLAEPAPPVAEDESGEELEDGGGDRPGGLDG